MELFKPPAISPFSPVLYNSPAVPLTQEQLMYIDKIADIACSDSQFRIKARNALLYVLTHGTDLIPTVTLLSPSTVVIGSPSFDIHIIGTNFTPESKIIFNGFEENTTFFSDTDIYTGVNMPLWAAPVIVPIFVMNANGAVSNSMNFEFVGEALTFSANKTPVLKPVNDPVYVDKVVKHEPMKTEVKNETKVK